MSRPLNATEPSYGSKSTMKRRLLKSVIMLPALMAIYVLAYVALSLAGQYQPSSIEYGGEMGYTWAPFGFCSDPNSTSKGQAGLAHWNVRMVFTFYPLWFIDTAHVHKSKLQ
jgi:hypothetical protein